MPLLARIRSLVRRRSPPPRLLLASRRAIVWAIVLAAAGVVLCLIPLFDLLGYESSFVVGLVGAIASADVATLATARDAPVAVAGPCQRCFVEYRDALGAGLALLLLPLALLAANALRVRNCDLPAGLAWYGVLAGADVACGAAVGLLASLVVPGGGWRTRLFAWALLAASLVWSLDRFWAAPPIFAYDPFGGFYAGSFYDENVRIGATLLLYRLMNGLFVVGAIALAGLLFDETKRRVVVRPREWARRRGAATLALVALTTASVLFLLRGRLGFAPDASDIARALGGRRETRHFVLIYPLGSEAARHLDEIARDHEFRYAELARELGVEPIGPGERVTSFLFASPEQKRDLMGAEQTFIAKPWLRQIYLQYEPFPHTVLKHELAHVFAGAFGDRLFHVSVRWRLAGPLPHPAFNVGLIEGAAVAADWIEPGMRLTPHQWSRAMQELGLLPDLGELFGLGFFGSNPSISYTVAGSFCRWLLDTRGVPAFRALYRSGGDFHGIYGLELGELGGEWRHFLETQPVGDADLAIARERFRRPSAFGQVCAHAIANAQDEASALLGAEHTEEALALLEHVCAEDPGEPSHLLDLARAADTAGDFSAARAAAQRLVSDPHASTPLVARGLLEEGDLAWRDGDTASARADFAQAATLPLDTPTHRLAVAEAASSQDPILARSLRPYFEGERDPDGHWRRIDDLMPYVLLRAATPCAGLGEEPPSASGPTSSPAGSARGLPSYLLGRQLLARDRFAEARSWLTCARREGLPDLPILDEDLWQLALAADLAGTPELAEEPLGALDASTTPFATRLVARDFSLRIRWQRGQPLPAQILSDDQP